MTTVTAVVLAFGDDPWLQRSVDALLASGGVDVDVVVVDNGAAADHVDALDRQPRVRVVRPGRNLGFAAGCNAGAAGATSDLVAFVNQDAVVEPSALAALAAAAMRPDVGAATGSVRLAGEPGHVNSAGNDVHFLGFSWAGGFGAPAAEYAEEREVAAASGTALVVRRELWEELGGFAEQYFAYYEDTELSFRCWQRGLSVVYVPSGVVDHRYEFSRSKLKYYLLERNRLLFVLTLFEAGTLVLLAPALVVAELAIVALAIKERWLGQKVAGWGWLVRNRRWIGERRRLLQHERVCSDADTSHLLTSHLRPGNVDLPRPAAVLDRVLTRYWDFVARRLGQPPARRG
jgi:GT2 family glycosyltransferase